MIIVPPYGLQLLEAFFHRAQEDPRIGVTHVSVYTALLYRSFRLAPGEPLRIYSHEIKPVCKVSGPATFHRVIRELDSYGYIRYVPSRNRRVRSEVWM